MAGVTLETAQAHLDAWLEAELRVAAKQSYSIAGRSLTFADLADIRESIKFWRGEVDRLSGGGRGRRGPRYIVGAP